MRVTSAAARHAVTATPFCKKESDDSEQFKGESQLQLSQTPVSGMTW
jgi:hypothetical protein